MNIAEISHLNFFPAKRHLYLHISQLSHVMTVVFFSPCICFPSTVSVAEPKMVRAALVTATSLALTGAVVAHAYFLKHQFYPTVVYLTKSSPSMAVRAVLKSWVWLKVCEYFTYANIFKFDISPKASKLIHFLFLFCFWYQVLYIQAFVLVFLLGKFMRKVFFGQLRAAEMEVELSSTCYSLCSYHTFPLLFNTLSLL